MPFWGSFFFQDSLSFFIEEFILFHDHIFVYLVLILFLVFYLLVYGVFSSFFEKFFLDQQVLEIWWTFSPSLVLVSIVFPSLKILYNLEDHVDRDFSFKRIGHQWYWSYEFSGDRIKEVGRFLENSSFGFRLLFSNDLLVLPFSIKVRGFFSSEDVIHSWTIPSLGVKSDVLPGRLNQVSFILKRRGVFFGQCSEICGVNHSFIPIVLERVRLDHFLKFLFFSFILNELFFVEK
jgi:cytochrome c oxidase subunit 2